MKVNQLKLSTFLMFVVLIIGCSNREPHYENISVSEVDVKENFESVKIDETENFSINDKTTIKPKDLKIIKSATTKYKVKDVKVVTNKIKKVTALYRGYISDLRFENNLYKKENRFTIKVPEEFFDSLMDSISSFSEFIDYENVTTKDVTEDYIDTHSRLTTKEEVKNRYETILRKKAKTVKDILATEDKLRIIQEEIDAAKGKLKYISNKVAYSTIQIDLYETVDYKEEPLVYKKTFKTKFNNGVLFGWELLQSLFIGVIYLWPLLLIVFIVLLFVKMKRKKQ